MRGRRGGREAGEEALKREAQFSNAGSKIAMQK